MTISSDRDKLRLLLGDTASTNVLFQDDELDYFLTLKTQIHLAAAVACEAAAAKTARAYDFETDGQAFKRSQQHGAWLEMAQYFRNLGSGVTTVDITKVDGYSDDILNQETSTSSSTVNPRRRYYGDPDLVP